MICAKLCNIRRHLYGLQKCIYCQQGNRIDQNNHLVIDNGEGLSIPLDDIKCVVVENIHTRLSASAVLAFAERNITLVFCNTKHLPEVQTFALYGASPRRANLTKQLEYP